MDAGLSFLAQGDSALGASPILLVPFRHPSPSTAALADTPERCGRMLLPRCAADCAAARLCCSSTPSRRSVGTAKHPGPRQPVLRTRYRAPSHRQIVIAGFFTGECFCHLLKSRRSVQLPQSISLSDAKQSRRSVASSNCVSANGSKRHTSEPNARCSEWMSHTLDFAFLLPSDR